MGDDVVVGDMGCASQAGQAALRAGSLKLQMCVVWGEHKASRTIRVAMSESCKCERECATFRIHKSFSPEANLYNQRSQPSNHTSICKTFLPKQTKAFLQRPLGYSQDIIAVLGPPAHALLDSHA